MATYTSAVVVLAVTFSVIGLAASNICYSANSRYTYYGGVEYYSDSTYCSSSQGCCSTFGSSATCCSSGIYYYYYDVIYYSTSLSTAAIAGIVIGCLAGIGVFIAIIICCCCACCRSQGTRQGGQVLTPVGGVGATVISTQNTTTQQAYPQMPPNQAMSQPYPGYNPAFVPDSAPVPGAAPYPNVAQPPPPYTNKY